MVYFTVHTSPTMASPDYGQGAAPDLLEVDSEILGDDDSAYGDELSAFTASLTSSVLRYRKENGRSYHGYRDGRYLIPNDEEEADRLDIMHEMIQTILDRRLYLAPIGDSPGRVLDLGTGTGIWAIQFADDHPSAEVTGIDLSPNQPKFVPPNVKFVVDDFEDEWAYGRIKFDFIRAHYLSGSVKDWPRLLSQAYESATPGGWVEFQDYNPMPYSHDGTSAGSSIEQYFNAVIPAFEKVGYVVKPGPNLEQWLKEAGFINVCARKFLVPFGMWPKDKRYKTIGTWNMLQLESGLEAAALAALTRHEGWSPEEVKILAINSINELRGPRVHAMMDLFVVYGQKPE